MLYLSSIMNTFVLVSMEIPLLEDVVIVLAAAVVVNLLLQRLKIPSVLAFILTGILVGPHGLQWVQASAEVDILAELGIVLLLFVIGLEFSLKSLAAIRKAVFLGGTSQLVGTIAVTALLAAQFGLEWPKAIFLGFLFSLSSTAIVLKILQERGEITSPQGKTILAILIFQDIAVVPMMLLAPIIKGESQNLWLELAILAAKGVGIILFVLLSARYVVPRILYQVGKGKSRELFILSILVICMGVAFLTSELGLSLALGAFLAGLIISESEYSHQATGSILPFREIFTSIFFVSIGMLLDLGFLIDELPVILLLVVITFIVKGAIASGAAALLKLSQRAVLLVGFSLFQVGEFAFVLSKAGIETELLDPIVYQYFLSVSLLTMAATPFVIPLSHKLADKLLKTNLAVRLKRRRQQEQAGDVQVKEYKDHLVIIGYGLNGRNVAKAAQAANISYLIIEMNTETVQEEKKKGTPIIFGDASEPHILEHVNIHQARVAVIAISDPAATKRAITTIREYSERVHLIVRTRFVNEIQENLKLGADEVIPEEFETSIEIFNRVLVRYLVPVNQIEDFTYEIRSGNYEMFRSTSPLTTFSARTSLDLPDLEFSSLMVSRAISGITNQPLAKVELRKRFGITVVAVKRQEELKQAITPEDHIQPHDLLYVVGRPEDIHHFQRVLEGKEQE